MAKKPIQKRLDDVLKGVFLLPNSFGSIPFWVYSPFLFWLPENQKEGMRRFIAIPRIRKAGLKMWKLNAVYVRELMRAKAEGKKVIMHPFNCPPEILHSFKNAVPMCTEVLTTMAVSSLGGGSNYYLDLGQELGFPETLCSGSRATVAAVLGGLGPKPDAIVTSGLGSCDTNTKLHELVAERCKVPLIGVEAGYVRDDFGLEYHKKTYRKSVESLEEVVGEEIDTERLREVIEKSNKATELGAELMDIRKIVPCPVPNLFNMFTQGARLTMWGRDEAIDLMETMVKVSKKRIKNGRGSLPEERVRAGWIFVGVYHNIPGIWHWLEEEKGVASMDGATLFPLSTIDTSSRETMIDGLAEHSWDWPMNRQMAGYSEHWSDDIIRMCREMSADCTIFGGHLACKNAWGALRQVADQIRDELGIPFLRLEIDSWDPRPTPIQSIQQELSNFFDTIQ